MATVNDIITGSLRRLGVLAEGEVPSFDQANDALIALNDLVDQWKAEKLQVYTETRTIATLTASQASFTVGTGGNINIDRPVFIRHVNFVDTSQDPDYEYQLPPLLTEDAYARIGMKAQTSTIPQVAYYNPTFPLGTLIPWPIPTSATLQWAMYHSAAIAEFAALTTTVSLPPGYKRMLRSNLAIEIAPDYGKEPDGALVKAAVESMATVKRANRRLLDLSSDPAALIQSGRYASGSYSIYQG